MYDVFFKLRYRRNRDKKPDYSVPASLVYFVRIDGVRSNEKSAGIEVLKTKWSGKFQKIEGYSAETQAKNRRISLIRAGLDLIHQELCLINDYVTPQQVLDVYLGKAEKQATILKAFDMLLDDLKNPKGSKPIYLKPRTLKKWEMARKHIEDFLKKQKTPVLPMMRFNEPMAEKYRDYLISKGFQKDHVSRNISYLKKVFKEAKRKGMISENLIKDVPCPRSRHVQPVTLNLEEIERLINYTSDEPVMQQCADVIVFLTFTGLDYCDYIRFNPKKHLKAIEEREAIQINRLKMERGDIEPKLITIPILPQARVILDKYNGLIPMLKYHTIRRNLLFILRNIGVPTPMALKNLRKTFGTYLLNKGLRLESIRDSVGHETIAMTERIYTKMYPETIVNDFKKAGLI